MDYRRGNLFICLFVALSTLSCNFIHLFVHRFISSLLRFVCLRFFREMNWKYYRILFKQHRKILKMLCKKWKKFCLWHCFFYFVSLGKNCKAPKICNANPVQNLKSRKNSISRISLAVLLYFLMKFEHWRKMAISIRLLRKVFFISLNTRGGLIYWTDWPAVWSYVSHCETLLNFWSVRKVVALRQPVYSGI